MILPIYTIIHTLISLVGIFTGLVVLFGMLAAKRLDGWTKWFLITTVATRDSLGPETLKISILPAVTRKNRT